MEYAYKFFLWQNGSKSVDLTQYLTLPIYYEDRLNEELDTAEVVLDRVPITSQKPFAPKTKFRLERYLDNSQTPIKKWDMVVDHDDVEVYVGEPNLCCHRINLIEPSVVAQGMHVDNIALTYELQDVSLQYKTYRTDTTRLNDTVDVIDNGYGTPIKSPSNPTSNISKDGSTFTNTYFYQWSNCESLRNLNLHLGANESHRITFEIPTLTCRGCPNGSYFEDLFQMCTITQVWRTETHYGTPVPNTETLVLSRNDGPSSFSNKVSNSAVAYSNDVAYLRTINGWNENSFNLYDTSSSWADHYGSGLAVSCASSSYTEANKTISFMTTSVSASEVENGKGYLYSIKCQVNPYTVNSIMDYYSIPCNVERKWFTSINTGMGSLTVNTYGYRCYTGNENKTILSPNSIFISASFDVTDLSANAVGGPMIMKGVKYSAYDLLRKALLTVDTQVINNNEIGLNDIEYPIIIDIAWVNRLKVNKVQETILENKNLWEVMLQIGYYLHAIPYLQFATDGTDRFMLSFRQLGDTKKCADTNTKITVFNSQNLSDYFTQYDSYVTNIFSPQNLVDEWLVVTTNDSSSLVSNNTAILQTTYGISEIVDFEIVYDGSCGGNAGTAKALNYIFEESIYQILTADYNVSPSKGDSIYYRLGQNTIDGLTYVAPTVNNDLPMSLKRIVGKLFSGINAKNLKFNNLQFHIKYRTQDSMRVSQVRPDIQNFMKNSSYEKYPKHSQYYGQQDKIVDSERFSLNLFGKLVKVGNSIYQRQEAVRYNPDEKESGDLVEISGAPFYVTEVENEFYTELTLQKATYSKNFNQLAQIVTIPSEPRFYEVSERSKIRREKMEYDFFEISTVPNASSQQPQFLANWKSFLKKLIFNKEAVTLPNYAWVRFCADIKRNHKGSYGQVVDNNELFPSSFVDRTNPSQIRPKGSSDHSDVVVPVLHFPIKDGIVFEWDMLDNFKAGDFIDVDISGYTDSNNMIDSAYYPKQSARYCDILGRADLYRFRLFNKSNWTWAQTRAGAKVEYIPTESQSIAYVPSGLSIALDKDCREELSFNYQISLLYRDVNNSGNFITFSNLFGTKHSQLYCCLLDEQVSMFNENTSVIPAVVLADKVNYTLIENNTNNQLEIEISKPSGVDLSRIKSVVFYEIDDENNKVSYLAKNFNSITGNSIPKLYIYPAYVDQNENGTGDVDTFNVSFIANYTTYQTQSVVSGMAPNDVPIPSKPGYRFLGWGASSNGGANTLNHTSISAEKILTDESKVSFYRVYPSSMSVTCDMTFYALWIADGTDADYYTTVFIANGENYEVHQVAAGNYDLAPAEAPQKDGCTFLWWALAGSGNFPISGEKTQSSAVMTSNYQVAHTSTIINYENGVNEDMTWYAVWQQNNIGGNGGSLAV